MDYQTTTTIELNDVDTQKQTKELDNTDKCCCNCNEWNWFQWSFWTFLLLISLFMASLAAPYFSFSDSVETWNHYHKEKYWVRLHIIPCFFAMLVSCHQICGPLRRRYVNNHKWIGRIYVICCVFGTIGGLYMATNANGGFPTRLSFTFIGVLWLITTLTGFYYIRFSIKDNESEQEKAFRIKQHRMWMLRSFALMIAVAMFRGWLPLFQFGFGYGADYRGEDRSKYNNEDEYQQIFAQYEQAYCAASWFCWTFNLTVIELYMWYQSYYVNKK